jgi:hypothetical protein
MRIEKINPKQAMMERELRKFRNNPHSCVTVKARQVYTRMGKSLVKATNWEHESNVRTDLRHERQRQRFQIAGVLK